MTQLNFEYDVRIPAAMIQQMMDREITPAMLVTMNVLYKWADWRTGRVRWCSSGGLRTATRKAYSDRTFRVSLQRLEEMGWITRHMTPGSHDDYPVTIHNYKWVCDDTCKEHKEEDARKVHILNPKDIKVSDPFATAPCREGSHETSHEGSREASQEDSQKVLSKHLPNPESQLLSDLQPKGKRKVSKQVSEAEGTACPIDLQTEEEPTWLMSENQKNPFRTTASFTAWINGAPGTEEPGEEPTRFNWSERYQREFSFAEATVASEYIFAFFPRQIGTEDEVVLMAEIALDFETRYQNPHSWNSAERYANDLEHSYRYGHMADYLAWNRLHKKGGMVHANVAEFHKAWFSDSDRCARIQWEDHDPSGCPKCKQIEKQHIEAETQEMAEANTRDREIVAADVRLRAAQSKITEWRDDGSMEAVMRRNQAKAKAAAIDANDI